MSTTMYRLFDINLRLLYVGIAGNPGRRFEEHAKEKSWWPEVSHIRTEHFEERADAEMAEMIAIQTEDPLHNITHRPRPTRPSGSTLGVELICTACDKPIRATRDDGYLEIDTMAVNEVERAWKAYLDGCRQENGLRFGNMGDLLLLPEAVPWKAWHRCCDPEPDAGNRYWIAANRIATWPAVMHWTAHLIGKNWLEHTTWQKLLYDLSEGGDKARPLRSVVRTSPAMANVV